MLPAQTTLRQRCNRDEKVHSIALFFVLEQSTGPFMRIEGADSTDFLAEGREPSGEDQ